MEENETPEDYFFNSNPKLVTKGLTQSEKRIKKFPGETFENLLARVRTRSKRPLASIYSAQKNLEDVYIQSKHEPILNDDSKSKLSWIGIRSTPELSLPLDILQRRKSEALGVTNELEETMEYSDKNISYFINSEIVPIDQLSPIIKPSTEKAKKTTFNFASLPPSPNHSVEDLSPFQLGSSSPENYSRKIIIKKDRKTSINLFPVVRKRNESQIMSHDFVKSDPKFIKWIKTYQHHATKEIDIPKADQILHENNTSNTSFIKQNSLDKSHSMIEKSKVGQRIETFGQFFFSTVDKDQNEIIPVFLKTTKGGPTGTMGTVDLWSKKQYKRVVKSCEFISEQKLLRNFSLNYMKYNTHSNGNVGKTESFEKKLQKIAKNNVKLSTNLFIPGHKKQKSLLLSQAETKIGLEKKNMQFSKELEERDHQLSQISDIINYLDAFRNENFKDSIKLEKQVYIESNPKLRKGRNFEEELSKLRASYIRVQKKRKREQGDYTHDD